MVRKSCSNSSFSSIGALALIHAFVFVVDAHRAHSSWTTTSITRGAHSQLQIANQRSDNNNHNNLGPLLSSNHYLKESISGWGLSSLLGQRKNFLSSIAKLTNIRGGSSNEGDDESDSREVEVSEVDDDAKDGYNLNCDSNQADVQEANDSEEILLSKSSIAEGTEMGKERNKPTDKCKRDKESNNNDDERYSRQMYALGARAHSLVRSTTAILDGPLGAGFDFSKNPIKEDVRVDGADGFDGLNSEKKREYSREENPSGLLYEIAKNLALSGVGRIILVRGGDRDDGYFDGSLDDLGAAYRRSALAEIVRSSKEKNDFDDAENEESFGEVENEDYLDEMLDGLSDGAELLAEYIQRLNPGVQVDIISRSKLLHLLHKPERKGEKMNDDENFDEEEFEDNQISLGTNPVVVCIDRSMTAQLEMNDACRRHSSTGKEQSYVPFVSVETAGVHARLFCDFGPHFVVVDEDGETPRSTLLDRIEAVDGGEGQLFTVHCLEGERHDVSRGDVIEFQRDNSDGMSVTLTFPKCQVVTVKSPTCFTVRGWAKEDDTVSNTSDSHSFDGLLEGAPLSFSKVKLPKTLSFSSLRDILYTSGDEETKSDCWDDDSIFAPSDLDKSFDPLRRKAVMSSMTALDMFVKKYGRLPLRPRSKNREDKEESIQKRTDLERFQSLLRKVAKPTTNQEKWAKITTQFANSCRAKFTPIQAFSGALGAQEVLKAATGLYNPVHQFLLYDCDEVLDNAKSENDDSDEDQTVVDMSPGQTYILGQSLSKKLASSRLFLVGAGAIGCELLKNLAAMGAGTDAKRGCIILTDMDTIERSNLSRQLLFRDHDVGEFKSAAARTSMLRFLPNCRIEAHTSRVGNEEDGPFDDDFWSSGCDVVLNALDNVEARLFVDSQCVANGLGLIDAGTLGPKGNVQVVVPHASESYGSSADPPEPDIPVCTLKNFPYEISHTIQWARDLFDGYFHRRPRQANDHVEEIANSDNLSNFAQSLVHKLGADAAVDMAEELGEDLGVFPFVVGGVDKSDPEYVQAVKIVCLNWAIFQAHRLFFVAMEELLQKHPVDSVDEDGAPFWSGTRRVPKPLRFIPLDSNEDEVSAQQIIINERIAQFVHSAARLRMESFLPVAESSEGQSLVSLEEALSALEEQALLLYKKGNTKKSSSDSSEENEGEKDPESIVLEKLNGAKTGASLLPELNLADFEKDDESNGHVAFVTAASNLRAIAYGIVPADAMETRRVAGRIVPAMITTTALVSSLSCLELVKVLKGLPLKLHRNAFVNLALPFFAFTAPLPAEEIAGVNGKTHTIWDRIVIKGSSKSPVESMTLRKFLSKVQKKASCGDEFEIANLSFGPFMIYANFLHSHDDELLDTPLIDIVKDAIISGDDGEDEMFSGDDANKDESVNNMTDEQMAALKKLKEKRFIDFSVMVESQETGEEFELPPIRLMNSEK
mmetsp:Transcript_13904/g.27252  ORF Transcript_13904/g.27252 Transcript_13904/m.27252 type:complete len:1445 (+) Transcript_13904:148-4482(+)